MIQQRTWRDSDDRESVIVPSPSVIAFSHSIIALVLQVLVAFEGVLVVLILVNFLNVENAVSHTNYLTATNILQIAV